MNHGPQSGQRPYGSIVLRTDLLQQIDEAQQVTLISAPAGYGKTTLLSSWIEARHLQPRVAWISATTGRERSQTLWFNLLHQVSKWAGQAAPSTAGASDYEIGAIVAAIVQHASELEAPVWLVFDDVHEFSREMQGHLAGLLDAAPVQLRFILSSRRDLRLGLHRLRINGLLTEIRQAELRFNLADTRALFDASGLTVPEASAQRLLDRTEGWAAGLRLAALSIARSGDPGALADRFSGTDRGVSEYLLAEVLDRQRPEVTRLLLRTSILDRVCGSLADHLTGSSMSRRILVELEDAGAFVVALDTKRTWFRYHPLFSELLELELRRSAPEELPILHQAAAAWCDTHGRPIDAIRHAQAAENWSLAARMLLDYWHDLFLGDQWRTAYELLANFPVGMSHRHPVLAVVASAEASDRGAFNEAERLLSLAQRRLPDASSDYQSLLELAIASERLRLARNRGDLAAAGSEAQRLLEGSERLTNPWLVKTLHAVALCNLGITEMWARQSTAEHRLRQALDAAGAASRPVLELTALTHLAMLEGARTAWTSDETAHRALQIAVEHGWTQAPFCALAYAVLAAGRLWRGQLNDAGHWLERGERCFRLTSRPAEAVTLYMARGAFELGSGSPRGALEILNRALAINQELVTPVVAVTEIHAHRCRCLLALGRIEQTRATLDGLGVESDQEDLPLHVADAMCYLAEDDPLGAIGTLDRVEGENHAVPWMIDRLLIRARAAEALGETTEVTEALERALDLAEAGGLVLPFLLLDMGDLVAQHVRRGTAHAALGQEIADILAGEDPSPEPTPAAETLTDTELRVLRYLPTNMQTPEIAATLFVSANTVRTHISHIYAKFGVHSRTEAVRQARRLGLLSPNTRLRPIASSTSRGGQSAIGPSDRITQRA